VAHINAFARDLFSGLPARYDLLAEVLSFGQNRRWRRMLVERAAGGAPGRVLDVATGTASVAMSLAKQSAASIVGLDLSEAMIGRGRTKVGQAGMSDRIQFLLGRAEALPFRSGSFDALTFTYLLRYVDDPGATLAELARVVKPSGPIGGLEFFVPPNPVWRACWLAYTRLLLPAGAALGGPAWYRVGRFLGPSISRHYRRYPLEWHLQAWHNAGIVDVQARIMSLGGGLVMWGRKARG